MVAYAPAGAWTDTLATVSSSLMFRIFERSLTQFLVLDLLGGLIT